MFCIEKQEPAPGFEDNFLSSFDLHMQWRVDNQPCLTPNFQNIDQCQSNAYVD
jgi:hypothetical protein